MSDRLEEMFELQNRLQTQAYGTDIATLSDFEAIDFIKDMHIALTDELHEMLGEVGWKPWATSKHINSEAAKGELVDAWHFFMNLCIVVGLTPDELYSRYKKKREKNIKRQEEGYDGVSTKCPKCKRALMTTQFTATRYATTARLGSASVPPTRTELPW
jgi:dimeric dUTPase (all-alpha-NTP-PPase superfamily)